MSFKKAVVATLAVPFILGFSPYKNASANQEYSVSTTDPVIIKAMDKMDGTSGEWAKKAILGDNVSGKPIKVQFKDLALISPKYRDFDALGWRDGKKQLYIFVNTKHKTAPSEALASLLSHEAVHQDEYCSIEEETYAWGYEADVWLQQLKRNPQLKNLGSNIHPLVYRLNTLANSFKSSNYTTKGIRQMVSSNPGYYGLPLYSPGFERGIADSGYRNLVNVTQK